MDDSQNPKPPAFEGPRSFAVLLDNLRDDSSGDSLNAQVSAELHELTEYLQGLSRANDAKATGELTLKLKVTVNGKSATLVPEINTKKPKHKVREYPLWVTRGGNLSTDHPTQQRLPLRPVREGSNDTGNEGTPKTKEL